jgi:signal transduction histidine kinase
MSRSTAPIRARLSMRVTDTGIGMTTEEQTHVFEDFGQADGSIARKYRRHRAWHVDRQAARRHDGRH